MATDSSQGTGRFGLGRLWGRRSQPQEQAEVQGEESTSRGKSGKPKPPMWSMGVLNDPDTIEVPGSVLLLAAHRNEPLGMRNVHMRTSHSSIPTGFPVEGPATPGGTRPAPPTPPAEPEAEVDPSPAPAPAPADEEGGQKKTDDGTIILSPQPDDSVNDPLNWSTRKRDVALLSLGIYCMVGGGMTTLIAAGFANVAETYHIKEETVSLTTGLYMMGLGVGSVIFSPTAILWGKRPVYLFSAVMFIVTSLWAGFSPSFGSLIAARVFQGISVSPVECLPSATIAEIFFLHERAYRIGIYTLLLLGGKNLVPLVSAIVIGAHGWRWAFFVTAMVVAFCGILLFLFVPETFWDRTPTRAPQKRPSFLRRISSRHGGRSGTQTPRSAGPVPVAHGLSRPASPGAADRAKTLHVGFAPEPSHNPYGAPGESDEPKSHQVGWADASDPEKRTVAGPSSPVGHPPANEEDIIIAGQTVPTLQSSRHSIELGHQRTQDSHVAAPPSAHLDTSERDQISSTYGSSSNVGSYNHAGHLDPEKLAASDFRGPPKAKAYTHNLRAQPQQSFTQQLKPFHGRLNSDNWFKVMLRPFILFAYPTVLWSSVVYACAVGWLIVISESISIIYRDPDIYGFNATQTGLVYVSPFIGGILGTAVAGKISDIIVKAMARRNGGLYEPEFRLVMAVPILITTCIGLMGFGWSAEERDPWIAPTLFFGVVSFGCTLASTTAITFCVDSYRQYAGEALVTLNFSKNIFHGLVFSLFVTHWLEDDGPKTVFIWLGVIQLIFMLFTIPMYIYGKRARMWTARMNLMEKF